MRVAVFEGEGIGVGKVWDDKELKFKGESEEGWWACVGGGTFGTVGGGYCSCCFQRQLHS